MTDKAVSALTSLTGANTATGDLLYIVDISEAAAADRSKKITVGDIHVSIPNGTNSAPSIAFASDPDTGIFRAGANSLAFAVGGTQAVTVDSSGNLGVGATVPSRFIDFEKNQNASTVLRVGNTTSGTAAYSALQLSSNTNTFLYNFSSGYTTSGMFAAGSTLLDAGGTGGLGLNAASGSMIFYAASSEKARITSSGILLVGTTTDAGLYNGTGADEGFAAQASGATLIQVSADANIYCSKATGYSNSNYIYFSVNGSAVGSITTNGTATAYNTSSDYRLKENIQPMTGALAKVAQLNPVTFNWKVNGSAGQGFIAHELQAVCPDAVTGEKDGMETRKTLISEAVMDADGNEVTPAVYEEHEVPKYQGVDSSFLVATLVAAIKELKAEFDAYKAAHP